VTIRRREPRTALLMFCGEELGLTLPGMGRVVFVDGVTIVCTSPREFLVLDADLTGRARTIDVSDAWVLFDVAGAKAREALATMVPIDLHPDSFGPGDAAATYAAHVSVLIWRHAGGFTLGCLRSYAGSFAHHLERAAAPRNA
jgi:sarcosine oxidase subunit gamma